MEKTSKKLIEEYVEKKLIFKNAEQFNKYIVENKSCPDYVVIEEILYTMDEYDRGGQSIWYGNKRTGFGFKVETKNRYEKGFNDAFVEEPFLVGCFRNDISYAD